MIVGVVFEDSIRSISRKVGMPEKGKKLDPLIDQLVRNQTLTPAKAKRAKAAAHVRTKATHAQWDEVDLKDVEAAVTLTEELIKEHLD